MQRFGDGRDWFAQRRLGLFIHWGLYAIPAWHEQHPYRRRVYRGDYWPLMAQWNPVRFDPDAWLDLAEQAGMSYVCFTTKHCDGFCNWATAQTDFNTMNTPYGRDILAQLAEACQRRGFPLNLYYSCVDWNHPNYPNEGRHHELPGPQPGDRPDLLAYVEYVRAQARELCANYGELGGFWWDCNVPEYVDRSLNDMIRELQPNAVINDRGYDEGDFGTPEREWDQGTDGAASFERPIEACQSVGVESWGYRRDEDFYTDRHLLRSIAKYLARGANYLLNVGPQADGTIPLESAAILRRVGAWYHQVREAFDDVQPANELTVNRDVLLTRRANTLYVLLHREPLSNAVKLKPITAAPVSATLLNTGAPVDWTVELAPSDHVEQVGYLKLQNLPTNELANTALVVRLEFDGPVETAISGDENDVQRR